MKTAVIRKNAFRNKTSARWHPALVVTIITSGATLFVYAIYLFQQALLPQPPRGADVGRPDPALEITVNAIAAKFICACGNCGEKSLDVCTCPDADKERETIRRRLQTGEQPEQVIATINDMYGGLKSEFSTK